jgi:hypothetical protein
MVRWQPLSSRAVPTTASPQTSSNSRDCSGTPAPIACAHLGCVALRLLCMCEASAVRLTRTPPRQVNAILASRACRSAVMVGTQLQHQQMAKVRLAARPQRARTACSGACRLCATCAICTSRGTARTGETAWRRPRGRASFTRLTRARAAAPRFATCSTFARWPRRRPMRRSCTSRSSTCIQCEPHRAWPVPLFNAAARRRPTMMAYGFTPRARPVRVTAWRPR